MFLSPLIVPRSRCGVWIVLDADRPRIVVGHVDAADAEADIVDDAVQLIGRNDLVNRFADPVGEFCGFFDPCTGLRPHMHLDLSAIDAWEEVLAQIRGKREREQGEADEPGDQFGPVVQTEMEQADIAAADRLEATLKGLLEPHQRIAARDVWIEVGVVMGRTRA
jgi:hypothetical protein